MSNERIKLPMERVRCVIEMVTERSIGHELPINMDKSGP